MASPEQNGHRLSYATNRREMIASLRRRGFWHGYYSRMKGMPFNPDWAVGHLEGDKLQLAQIAYEDGRMIAHLALDAGHEIHWPPKSPVPAELIDFCLARLAARQALDKPA